ncbi:hypothetical protein LB559_06420 [Mesorhizobium sp. BR1-1-3]|uniref:hypothetical protein n=1 Tax=unclassified Mesorhizobium TaxID=325217 RepID=UPI000F74DED0|nr:MULTISPECIES: hypothetical protein [unclassified Mesorhizobium]AZO45290.1 hypothetical protein EJ076_31420 [Mesorhizobium sp. M7D.F.Ca.US.005.01.1.1]MBZ9887573.1 hypothetical protein [Mesorhizobium sp. BR1-1-3]
MLKLSTYAAPLLAVLPLVVGFAQAARADEACTDEELTRKIQPTVDLINSRLGEGVCVGARDGVLLFSTSLGLLENCTKDSADLKRMRATFRKSLNEAREEEAGACSQ